MRWLAKAEWEERFWQLIFGLIISGIMALASVALLFFYLLAWEIRVDLGFYFDNRRLTALTTEVREKDGRLHGRIKVLEERH